MVSCRTRRSASPAANMFGWLGLPHLATDCRVGFPRLSNKSVSTGMTQGGMPYIGAALVSARISRMHGEGRRQAPPLHNLGPQLIRPPLPVCVALIKPDYSFNMRLSSAKSLTGRFPARAGRDPQSPSAEYQPT